MKNRVVPHYDECQLCPHKDGADLCDVDGLEGEEFKLMRRTIVYSPGQFVFYEGHPALGLYILCSGRVKLSRVTSKGQHRVVALVEPGSLIEKQTFQEGAVHSVTCQVLEPSQVCLVDRLRYLDLLKRNSASAIRILQLLSREIGGSLREADQLAFASARERMARLLLELADRYGEQVSDGVRITIQLKREELAQMAAVTVETAVRLLQTFQSELLIRIKGRDIVLLEMDRLERASHRLHAVP